MSSAASAPAARASTSCQAVDGEVLAEHRQRHRGPHRHEVGEGAAEARAVGEHRDGGGAGRLVAPGLRHRVEAGRDGAGRGAGPLHLGDDPDRAAARREGGEEVPRRRGVGEPGAQLGLAAWRPPARPPPSRFRARMASR